MLEAHHDALIEKLKKCGAIAAATDETHNEAEVLEYCLSTAEDVFRRCLEDLFPRLVAEENADTFCETVDQIMNEMGQLFSQLQYPRTYRWFIRWDPSDL